MSQLNTSTNPNLSKIDHSKERVDQIQVLNHKKSPIDRTKFAQKSKSKKKFSTLEMISMKTDIDSFIENSLEPNSKFNKRKSCQPQILLGPKLVSNNGSSLKKQLESKDISLKNLALNLENKEDSHQHLKNLKPDKKNEKQSSDELKKLFNHKIDKSIKYTQPQNFQSLKHAKQCLTVSKWNVYLPDGGAGDVSSNIPSNSKLYQDRSSKNILNYSNVNGLLNHKTTVGIYSDTIQDKKQDNKAENDILPEATTIKQKKTTNVLGNKRESPKMRKFKLPKEHISRMVSN